MVRRFMVAVLSLALIALTAVNGQAALSPAAVLDEKTAGRNGTSKCYLITASVPLHSLLCHSLTRRNHVRRLEQPESPRPYSPNSKTLTS